MTAALHTPQDSGVQRNSTLRVTLTFESRESSRPREASFLLHTFLWTRKEKYGSKTQKKFSRPIEEDGFCVSTLEKEGTPQPK